MSMIRNGLLAITACLLAAMPGLAQDTRVLDAFETTGAWEADASTDVTSTIRTVPGREGQALRLDFDFNGRAGYAFAAREIDLTLPDNYEISFWVRGVGPLNTFEVKFTDAENENVWWRQITRYDFPDDWTLFTIKRRQVSKAWGPGEDPFLREAARMEFVVVAAEGGSGHIEIDQLTLRELPPEPSVPPRPLATTTSELAAFPVSNAVDGDPSTVWRSEYGVSQGLTLDLGYEREFGGLVLHWEDGGEADRYSVSTSNDGLEWTEIARVEYGDGGTDWLRTPEASGRYLQFDLMDGEPTYGLSEIEIRPLAFGASQTAFVTAIASDSRRGQYPRGFHGEQPYWTLVGVDGGGESGLMGEDGAIELRRGGPSIEPFILEDGRLTTWADVNITQGLRDDDLPMPWVEWQADGLTLKIEAFADGTPESSRLFGRYHLTNTSDRARTVTLALMARPYQVNGPRQFLAVPGGVGPILQIDWTGGELVLNDDTRVRPLVMPDAVAASIFASGADPHSLLTQPDRRQPVDERLVESDDGLMAGALFYEVTLQPGETRQFGWMLPMAGVPDPLPVTGSVEAALDAVENRVAADWRAKIDRVDLILPPQAQQVEDVLKSSLAHILMSRQGPILQPGTRSYNRSWIRDGAMIAEGLNRLGHADISADYLRWFAPYVFDNGKVPCCVDARGADPVPENDSHGEFVFLAAEVYRYTGDRALLRDVWPQVEGAIAYMDELRAETRTAEFQTPDTRHLYGLLPPTISHEGYSDKPAYSYWDDFWGLVGYRDAVFIADVLGEDAAEARFAAGRDQFSADISAAIIATAAFHDIDWIAGAADRGDFDATSTTIGLSPGGLIDVLPQDLLRRTFDLYWLNFEARRTGDWTPLMAEDWDPRPDWLDYTPYELRAVGAFVRLGQRDRAIAALDYFFGDLRPQAWNGWAEVVGRHEREPRFIGDMPHAWISSDYIRSALDLFVHERDRDHALVLAAGIPLDWIETEEGVGIANLRTAYGPVSWHLRQDGRGYVLDLATTATPPGGFVLAWPPGSDVRTARIDGRLVEWSGGELVLPRGTRRVELR
ncbi:MULTISPECIES: discoidin domain-containing protein [unclassified Brevundimonas]|uniref:discoidin domain-containing protein n=1 Tax=unclassified Brevundimonas TaxID=2622653 RepID=UPI00257C5E12|nr:MULTISPECIES: discoidin domain-containing protein [unclassified Brevundimonas]|tara:strand:+ start:32350 stop:35547 length:3198 start_codon:yes stop_codon:yes gene_type:complete